MIDYIVLALPVDRMLQPSPIEHQFPPADDENRPFLSPQFPRRFAVVEDENLLFPTASIAPIFHPMAVVEDCCCVVRGVDVFGDLVESSAPKLIVRCALQSKREDFPLLRLARKCSLIAEN